MVLKTLAVFGLAAGLVRAETLTDRLGDINERMLSKNGVQIGGNVNAEFFHSGLDGSAVDQTRFTYENTQFTSVDLDMRYRPYDFVGARALLRFHQDWQTFFATRSRIVAARWLSMDGNISNMLGFDVGDFREKLTPLTLWAPELDLVYEPEIFSDARTRLMDEQFLGDNNRPMQGAKLNFAKRFNLPITEFRLDGVGSRISRSEYLDPNGWQAVLINGNRTDTSSNRDALSLASSDMDRFFFAGNAEALLWDNAFVGGTYQTLLDDRESYQTILLSDSWRRQIIAAGQGGIFPGLGQGYLDSTSLNGQDSVVAKDLRIASGRAGVDLAGFLHNKNLTLQAMGEYALSTEANAYAWHYDRNASGTLENHEVKLADQKGSALDLHLEAGYGSKDGYGLKLVADYLNNESGFENPLAQSPTFIGTRVMNTDNDRAGGALYSTFDAMNNGVYKFTPTDTSARYQFDPFSKTSYHSGTLTSRELAAFTGDPVVQLLLPFGLATPNRTGYQARLNGDWSDAVHVQGDFAQFKELQGAHVDSLQADARAFTQMGGGVKLEAGKLWGWSTALDLSGSYVRTTATRAILAGEKASPDIDVDLMQAGLTWRFLHKWGLLGGYQRAVLKMPLRLAQGNVVGQYTLDETQSHFRVGVEYAVTRNAYLLVSGGRLQVQQDETHRGDSGGGAANPAKNASSDFSQLLSQALVKVRF